MIFGSGKLQKSLYFSGTFFSVSLCIFFAVAVHSELNSRNYDALKQTQTRLLTEESLRKQELGVLKAEIESYRALPLTTREEHLRARILDILGDLTVETEFFNLEFQFYSREFLQLSVKNSDGPKISVDSFMLKGRIRHMGEFFEVLDFLALSGESYEIRGCEIKRSRDELFSVKEHEVRDLDVHCLLSWYGREHLVHEY